jgi:hypothetical protein
MATPAIMKNVLFLLGFLFPIVVSAQAPLSWGIAEQGHGNGYDDASSVTFDTDGNLYATGYFASDSITFGTFTLQNSGQSDAYVVKFDMFLTPIWAAAIGGSAEEYGLGITCDSSNNIIVVGNYASPSISLGSFTLNNSAASTPDMFIARMDVNGNFIWARSEGGSNWDNCAAVDMNTANGDVYVAAAYYLDTMIIGSDTLLNRGGYDLVLMKFDINGNYLWSRNAGGNYNDLANAVAYDKNNNCVVISGGFASDSLKFPTDTLLNPAMALPETFVVKYDVNGNCIWAERSGAGDNDHSVGVDIGSNGNIYVGGHYHSPFFVFANDTLFNQGQGDVYLLVYDVNGVPLWSKSAGGLEQDFGYNVFVDGLDNIYYAGMFSSITIDFGTYQHNNPNINENMFMTVYDQNGNETGSISGGGLGTDYINSVVANPGGIYVVGGFGTPGMTMGLSTLTNTDASGNTFDMFIATTSIPLGEDNIENENEIKVYPNPSSGIFNFVSAYDGEVVVKVYNSVGKEIISRAENNGKNFSVELTNEAAGIYFVVVQSPEGTQQIRLGKE